MPFYSYDNHRDTCAHCGAKLSARQELWCSDRCRQAARALARRPIRRVTCEVCGNVFTTRDGRKKRCAIGTGDDADAGPGDPCWELQNAADAAEAAAVDARDFPECAHCGQETEYAGTGRHRKYCSGRCRVYAYRARKGRNARTAV